MKRIYSAGNLQEAYLILHRLAHAGISARVLNEHAQGGVGDLPFTHAYPEVWLLEPGDAERARRLIEDYERTPAGGPPRVCGSCREENPESFETCWRCGAILDR